MFNPGDRLTVPSTELFLLAKESLKKTGKFTFITRGYSMYPAICHQEKVTIEKIEPDKLKIGDVLFCNTEDGPLLHRIVEIIVQRNNKLSIKVRGDKDPDSPHTITVENIAGRICKIYKRPSCRLKAGLKKLLTGKFFNFAGKN